MKENLIGNYAYMEQVIIINVVLHKKSAISYKM